jgi:mRNA interferase MazF
MRQYEIRWANLPLPIGRRPVLLLTRTSAYTYLNKVIVVEITSTIREIPQEVPLGEKEGLQHSSGDRIGMVGATREAEIKRALGYALNWPELKAI